MCAKAPWSGLEQGRFRTLLRGLLCWMVAGLLAGAGSARAAAALPEAAAALEPVVVGVVLNGTLLADSQLVHRQGQGRSARIWLPLREAGAWRMDTTRRQRQDIEGVTHIALCGVGVDADAAVGDRCFYDDSSALLTLSLQSQDLLPLRIAPPELLQPAVSDSGTTGGYANYDVSAWHVRRPGLSAQLEGRVHTPYGQGHLRLDGVYAQGARRTLAAALWQVDRPQQGVSAQAGNIQVPDTAFGSGLSLLGVRLGSNTRLQPMVQNMLRPVLTLPGATRSLRADVFVDGQYRQTAEVPYGPYVVEVQPGVPGQGQIDIVSTDVTGQQTRVGLPFYQSPSLLKAGARVWSVDVGRLQDGYGGALGARGGLAAGGTPVASAALRLGLDNGATVQMQAVKAPGAWRLASALDTAHPRLGLSSFSALVQSAATNAGTNAAGHTATRPRTGVWLSVGHEYLSRKGSASLRTEHALHACANQPASADAVPVTTEVRRDSMAERMARPCRQLVASLGVEIAPRWSLSAALSEQSDARGLRSSASVMGLRFQASGRSELNITAQSIQVAGRTVRSFGLSWAQPLGASWSGQSSMQHRAGKADTVYWSAQSVPEADDPSPRRMQAFGSLGPQPEVGGRYAARASVLDWRAEARVMRSGAPGGVPGGAQGAVGVAGALGVAAGRVFATRRIDDAFVVVEVGLPDLPVLLDNREVTRTNAQGWAVVGEARAHQANVVGVDIAKLPIQYSMPRDQLSVVPASSAGVVALFDLSDGGIALPVVDGAGLALPRGAAVQVSGQRMATAVTSRSEVFLDRSDRAADVTVRWSGRSCGFRYTPDESLPTHVCK